MIKSIMVGIDGSAYSDSAAGYGVELAKQLDAHLAGIHVLDSRMLEGPMMADISGWIGAQPYSSQLQQFRDVLEQKGRTIVDAFNQRCADAGVQGEGVLRMGHPSRVLLEEEVRAELMLLGQRGLHANIVGEALGSVAERVVRHSIKPCMVVPQTLHPIRKILMAYDGSGHASQALHEAIEFSQSLDVELVVLTVAEGEEEWANATSEEAMRMTEAHKCHAISLISDDPDSARSILANCEEQGADLIVMGAYGHSRIREWILGSTTTYVMTQAEVPVLLVR